MRKVYQPVGTNPSDVNQTINLSIIESYCESHIAFLNIVNDIYIYRRRIVSHRSSDDGILIHLVFRKLLGFQDVDLSREAPTWHLLHRLHVPEGNVCGRRKGRKFNGKYDLRSRQQDTEMTGGTFPQRVTAWELAENLNANMQRSRRRFEK